MLDEDNMVVGKTLPDKFLTDEMEKED